MNLKPVVSFEPTTQTDWIGSKAAPADDDEAFYIRVDVLESQAIGVRRRDGISAVRHQPECAIREPGELRALGSGKGHRLW